MQHARFQATGTQRLAWDDVSNTGLAPGSKRHLRQRVIVTRMSVLIHAPVSFGVFELPCQSHLTRGKCVPIDLVWIGDVGRGWYGSSQNTGG